MAQGTFYENNKYMKNFSVGTTIGLLQKTAPFLIFRFLIYFAITMGYVILTGAGVGVGYGAGLIFGEASAGGAYGGFFGFAAASMGLYLLREYLLYIVKAGHIAVLVEVMDGGEIPGGRGQIEYAQAVVRERFTESSTLFAVDQLIKGVLKAFNKVFFAMASFLPIPGLQGLAKFLGTVVRLSLTYMDEVILANYIRSRDDNPWKSSRMSLTLYAQNYKIFLKNAVFLALIIWGLTAAVFLLVLAPVAGLVALFPGTAGPLTFALAVVFTWGIKEAIIEPFGMTAMMQVFFKVTAGQQPNPEWEQRLDSVSSKFGELKSKAGAWTGTSSAPAQTANTVGSSLLNR